MTTAKDVYAKALVLMDSQNDADTTEYEAKAPSIINTLLNDLYPYSDTWEEPLTGLTAVCPEIENLTSEMPIDDKLSRQVLPWGLGGMLLMDENPSTANFLWSRYGELLAEVKRGVGMRVSGSQDITDAYSSDGTTNYYYNKFTVWG